MLGRHLVALAGRTDVLAGIEEQALVDVASLLRPVCGPAWPRSAPPLAPTARPTAARALSFDERESVRAVLNSEGFDPSHIAR